MAVTVGDVYQRVCDTLLEPGGLQLGIVTFQQFIDLLNLCILDFIRETCPVIQIDTLTVQAGVSQYDVPDSMMRCDDCFIGGVYLEQSTVQRLTNSMPGWRRNEISYAGKPLVMPIRWHGDQLPIKTIELVPVPQYNSTYIPGTAEPDPPHGQIGDWYVTISGATVSPEDHLGLTMIGPQLPTAVASLVDSVPLIPDDFVTGYLALAVLARIFGGDNEAADPGRASWCEQQLAEGKALLQAVMSEPEAEAA